MSVEELEPEVYELARELAEPLVTRGLATVGSDEGGWLQIEPSNTRASALLIGVERGVDEVSIYVYEPSSERALEAVLFGPDRAEVLSDVSGYIRATIAGRVELVVRKGGTRGRLRAWFEGEARPRTYYDNVLFGCLVGHGNRWDRVRPEPYDP